MADKIFDSTKGLMDKALEAFRLDLAKLRTGRASLALIEGVRADYYGTPTPLNQLATLSVPDARTIAIQPWDTSAIQAIEKAIQSSDLGLMPINDGKLVRINIPSLNEERRRELVKVAKKHAEENKVRVRNVRRDANEQVKNDKKAGTLTEDDERKALERIQKLTDDYIKLLDDTLAHKEKDIMEV